MLIVIGESGVVSAKSKPALPPVKTAGIKGLTNPLPSNHPLTAIHAVVKINNNKTVFLRPSRSGIVLVPTIVFPSMSR